VELSFIDRLVDTPEARLPKSTWQLDRALRASLCRDLADLLNNRRAEHDIDPLFDEATNSLLTFGIPDFSQRNPFNKADVDRVERSIKQSIKQFEPRLIGVEVHLIESKPLGLRFRIDARLRDDDADFHATVQCDMPRAIVTETS